VLIHHDLQTVLFFIHPHAFSIPSETDQQLTFSKIFFIDGYTPLVENPQHLIYSVASIFPCLGFFEGVMVVVVVLLGFFCLGFVGFFFTSRI